MKGVLKPSQLRTATGKILDKAIRRPQYVSRNGVLLVITTANSVGESQNEGLLSPWEQRAKTLERFYAPTKAW